MMRKGLSLVLAAGFAGAVANAANNSEAEWIAKRVAQIKESESRPWTKVPWVASLLEARRISQDEQRPLFLFSSEGNLDTGRC